MKSSNKLIAFLLGFAFFLAALFTLPDYNINWDIGNHAMRGQAYLHFFLTGNRDYSDLPKFKTYWQKPESLWLKSNVSKKEIVRRSAYQYDGYNYNFTLETDSGHPPLSDIISSFFNLVLFQKLGLINDIDAYRVYGIVLSAILVGVIYWWATKIYGKFAGIVAALSLSLYPLFWSHTHFNTDKDIPETVFYSLLLFSVWRAVALKSWKWLLVSGVIFGLALGTKFNILFAIFVILPWLVFIFFKGVLKKLKLSFFLAAPLAILMGIIIFIGTWPYLWQDIFGNLAKVVSFYKGLGLTTDTSRLLPFLGVNTYPIQTVIYSTPPVILALFLIGVVALWGQLKKEKEKASVLILLWFLAPIIRVSLRGTNIHGGIRQIMEFIPAMALIAGLGGEALKSSLIKIFKFKKIIYSSLIVLVLFVPLLVTLVRLHPSEEFYFNFLIGGLRGAKQRNYPYWGENYGSPYRKAVEWINQNAEAGAKVVFPYELMMNIPRIFFRPDLEFSNVLRSGYLRQGEYAIGLIYQGVEDRSYYDMYLNRFLEPVYQTLVDGVPILKVWKNDKQHLKKPWQEEPATGLNYKVDREGIKIDLGQILAASRVEIDYGEKNCPDLSLGYTKISEDGVLWRTMPKTFPNEWRISSQGRQPRGGKFTEPLVGLPARYIQFYLTPEDTCLKKVIALRVFYLVNTLDRVDN